MHLFAEVFLSQPSFSLAISTGIFLAGRLWRIPTFVGFARAARQALWDLRQSPESMANIDPLLARMSEQVSHEFSVPVSYQMFGRPYDLDHSTVHELLMVAREALYNSVPHGRPRQVQLYLSFDENGSLSRCETTASVSIPKRSLGPTDTTACWG